MLKKLNHNKLTEIRWDFRALYKGKHLRNDHSKSLAYKYIPTEFKLQKLELLFRVLKLKMHFRELYHIENKMKLNIAIFKIQLFLSW